MVFFYFKFTKRISGLDHESLDDAVKDVRIIVAILAMNAKVFHCLGTLFAKQLNVDIAQSRVEHGSIVDSLAP